MEVAHKEGWNPGLYDAMTFYQIDEKGFFAGELEGSLVGGVSAARSGENLVFIGNHFVLPPFRAKGYGKRLWEWALGQAGDSVVVINGLTDGREFYESYGFGRALNVIRYKGAIFTERSESDCVVPTGDVDFARLLEFDAAISGARRQGFLKIWLDAPGMESRCLIKNGEILSWACMRRCRRGWLFGPVYGIDFEAVDELIRHMAAKTLAEDAYLDIPETNADAIKLAFAMGMTPVGARARMFKNGALPEAYSDIYGFTSLDIG